MITGENPKFNFRNGNLPKAIFLNKNPPNAISPEFEWPEYHWRFQIYWLISGGGSVNYRNSNRASEIVSFREGYIFQFLGKWSNLK